MGIEKKLQPAIETKKTTVKVNLLEKKFKHRNIRLITRAQKRVVLEINKKNLIMSALNKPEPLSFTGSLDENWKKFKQAFEIFSLAAGIDEKEQNVHCTGSYIVKCYW
jgi:hypothetical protein